MQTNRRGWISLIVGFAVLSLATFCSAEPTKITEEEAVKLGTSAYIYGYPLVTMDVTRQVMTNVANPEGMKAPMGQFAHAREYPNASFRDVTAPNADTLYSVAWLDLSKEPYILHIPATKERYYLMPLLSAWTEVFANPGTRTIGNKAQTFAIVGPDWTGTLPKGVTELQSPTDMVWVLGRTYSNGTPEDIQAVREIQNQYTLTPLSSYGKPYTPPRGTVDSSIDTKTPVRDQVNAMNAATYFKRLAALLQNNPPADIDKGMVAKLKRIGIVPCEDFDLTKLDPEVAKGLEEAVKQGQEKILAKEETAGEQRNGWTYALKTGTYGNDYLQRAFITTVGLGANLPQDAIYPTTHVDNHDQPLEGTIPYVIHFAKGQTPPVQGFWSLTLYNDQYFFAENQLNRFTLSSRDPLKYNEDGSLDLYIQHDSPGQEKESNWLPAPSGKYVLMFRFYWPKDTLATGFWNPPAVMQPKEFVPVQTYNPPAKKNKSKSLVREEQQ